MIGTKLSHYEITSHLGTGGMGEVYQATDTKLKRNVAIKILPQGFTQSASSFGLPAMANAFSCCYLQKKANLLQPR